MPAVFPVPTIHNHLPKREATGEGGLITGTNPTAFTPLDPLRLWIIQVAVIIITAQLLHLGLRRLRQPKVIAEMLSGILLGPTALGRIPNFTENIFPSVSLPYLSLAANIGLCLYLFLVGLEIDANVMKRNARTSMIVSLAGTVLPFGLGTALSTLLYHHFIGPSVHFTYFMLFTGVAYSITAFPVLCRILTELKLLDTHVGIIVLSASVCNGNIGWILLALSVALVNAGSGLSALWILLVCIAFTIFLLLPVKFVLHWLARKTGSTENGPTMFYMTIVMITVWASAFFTDAIGVNAIFGTFLAGLVVPREGGLAIALTEKLEDIVSIVFLPLYFTLSGLNTNLGLLNDGITWAFTIAIIAVSFSGKFGGCAIASRLAGYGWRESGTIGALMSCKGLIELIVLNVGLRAGILSQRVFSMFIFEALSLTLITTPLVTALYPPERRIRIGPAARAEEDEKRTMIIEEQPWRHRFTIVLDKLDHIPGAMALTQLVLPPRGIHPGPTAINATDKLEMPKVSVEALQLIELSDRASATMKSSAADSLIHTDPVLDIFRTFGELNELAVTTSLSVVPYNDFAHSVVEHARRHASHLILLPWLSPTSSTVVNTPGMAGGGASTIPKITKGDYNPFEVLFDDMAGSKTNKSPSETQSQFVRSVFAQDKMDVALLVDTGDRSGGRVGGSDRLFLPFFGGPDDRLALEIVVQLCLNPKMTATVVRILKREGLADMRGRLGEELKRPAVAHVEDKLDSNGLKGPTGSTATSTIVFQDTIHSRQTTQMRLQSETADDIIWSKYASLVTPSDSNTNTNTNTGSTPANTFTPGLRDALSRIQFSEVHTSTPVHAAIRYARSLRQTSTRLLVVTGRSRSLAQENYDGEMERVEEAHEQGMGEEVMRRTIGCVGAAMLSAGLASAVVVQATGVALG